jgi:acyl-CoA synthetase (NDP forming)
VPVFDAATDACFKMLRGYMDYGQFLQRHAVAAENGVSPTVARPEAQAILRSHRNGAMLAQSATTELLGAYGLKCAAGISAVTGDEAKAAAVKLGYPVILKAMVPNIAHRNDAGLVSRKIANDVELQQEYAALQAHVRALSENKYPISVDKFIPHDFEVILGVKYDPTFGPAILCGLGGAFTEVLKDYALRLAPLTRIDTEDMLSSLKAFPILQKGATKDSNPLVALGAALLRLSDLAVELKGKISAVDINPVGLNAGSSEITVLDAKIHI